MRSPSRRAAIAAVSMLALPLVGGVLGGGPDAIWSEGGARGYGAGDLNGDGYDDVAIERDELEIYHGGPLGVDASTPSTTADIVFGSRPAGDVNDDGYDDLIIADYDLERADVYHGGPGGISGAPTPSATLTGSDDLFASDGRGAGDVDDDGYDDVIVTSPLSGAYVFNGSASGIGTRDATAADAALLNGAAPNFFFTMAAGRAGDVNGDGYDDVLLVSYLSAVAVVHGSAGGIPSGTVRGVADSIVTGSWGSGPIFAPAGDVNGDGYDDVLIDAEVDSQGALLLLGSASGVPSGTAASIGVTVPFTGFVQSLAGAGDVDGDGHDDVLVGEPTHCNQPGCTYVNGRAALYFGGTGGLDLTRPPIPFVSPYPADTLLEAGVGTILDGVGDVNLDGLSDILVGRFTSPDPRPIQLFHGGDNSVVPPGVPALSAPVAALAVLFLAAAGLATRTRANRSSSAFARGGGWTRPQA